MSEPDRRRRPNPNIEALPGTEEADPRRLGDGLDVVLRRLGGPTADTMGAVFSAWDDLVGAAVAAHSRPVSLRDGVLVVAVEDAAWASQLGWLEQELVARVAEKVGASVERIEVRVRPG